MAKKTKKTKKIKSEQKVLPGFFPDYLKPIATELESHYLFIEEISKGANGVAYKLSDHEHTNYYCLKTISPEVKGKKERQRIKDTLQKEVDILRPLSHQCLPKIYKSNINSDLPFYVCTYHPGKTFIDFKKSGYRFAREEAVLIITSLIDALEYIHKSGRTHCDLHQQNILISEDVFAEGILIIDFGSGHRESDDALNTPDRGHWALKSAGGLRNYKEDVNRHEAAPEFRKNDIRALGVALALMADTFFSKAPMDQILAYNDFCSVLRSGHLFDLKEVKERFDFVIDPRILFTSTDRLFIRKTGKRESITLPSSGEMPV